MSHRCDGSHASCLTCAALARRHAALRMALTFDDRLDKLTQQRIWNRLDEQIASDAIRQPSRAPRSVILRWTASTVAAAAAVAIAISILARHGDEPRVLEAPADTTLNALLGPHTQAALVGPARLEVIGTGEMTTVELTGGTLYAEFRGGTGRALRVLAPEATVDVVGTLFAVEISTSGTCVSVAHGRVNMTAVGHDAWMIGDGERRCTGDDATRTIEPRIRDALIQHETVLAVRAPAEVASTASRDPAPLPPTPSPSPPISPTSAVSPTETPASPRQQSSATSPTRPPSSERGAVPATSPRQPSAATSSTGMPPSTRGPTSAALPSTSPSSTVSTPADAPSAETLYRTAEAALARRDLDAADVALARIIVGQPTSRLLDQALYERARIAYQRHAWQDARRQLDALAAIPQTPLAEPGRYLGCRIVIESMQADKTGDPGGRATGIRCLTDYRAAYPRSPHDLDVLGLLIQLVHADGGCASARSLIGELVRSHPQTALANGWRTRCPEVP